jgi:predicted Rossmann fold nucleotide-binding protein DprA/Smf involved in DNA uptake
LTLHENKDKNEVGGKNSEENLVINILAEGGLHIDKIIEATKLSAAKTAGILAILEMEDKIRNLGGNVYAIKN